MTDPSLAPLLSLDNLPADLTDDSRDIKPGDAFLAVPGSQRDGHDFIPNVLQAGAALIVCERWSADFEAARRAHNTSARYVVLPGLREKLPELAKVFYGDPCAHMKVVGVTGTNGKTTTTHLIEALAQRLGMRAGLIGTITHRYPGFEVVAQNTTPGVLLLQKLLKQMVEARVGCVAMEVSSHALVQGRVDALDFDVGVWTQFGQDHLDFHGTLEAYRDAKLKLFDHALPLTAKRSAKNPVALACANDAVLLDLFTDAERRARLNERITLFGIEQHPLCGVREPLAPGGVQRQSLWSGERGRSAPQQEIIAHNLLPSPRNQTGLITIDDKTYPFTLPLLGRFNVLNALGALGAIISLGIDPAEAVRALELLPQVSGRMQRLGAPGQPQVIVDYAHTPEAVSAALEALRPFCKGQLHVVFGAGGDRDPTKRPRMGAAAAAGADLITITNDNPRSEPPASIADAILGGIPEAQRASVRVELDRETAIRLAVSNAASDDLVLIAGKGHEDYQIIGARRLSFDDRVVAADALTHWSHRERI